METKTFFERVINAVNNIKGCQFIGMEYLSAVKLNKAQSAIIGGAVTKVVSGQFQINYDYENAVNRRLASQGKEPNFSAKSLPWGVWVEFNKLIEHKGATYLRFYGVANEIPSVTYYIDGKVADDEQTKLIKGWTEKAPSATQSEVGLVEHQVVPRNINILNIQRIVINKETIVQDDRDLGVTA